MAIRLYFTVTVLDIAVKVSYLTVLDFMKPDTSLRTLLFTLLPRYEEEKKKLPPKGASREKQTLALLQRFSLKVQKAVNEDHISDEETPAAEDEDNDDDTW